MTLSGNRSRCVRCGEGEPLYCPRCSSDAAELERLRARMREARDEWREEARYRRDPACRILDSRAHLLVEADTLERCGDDLDEVLDGES